MSEMKAFEIRHFRAEVIDYLQEQRAARPRGFTEMELQQRFHDLRLRGLRRAVAELEVEGWVERTSEGLGQYRIALTRAATRAA
jgi:hypothetical protein